MELCDHVDFSGSLTCSMEGEERKMLVESISSLSVGQVLAGGHSKHGETVASSLSRASHPQVPDIWICPMCPANLGPQSLLNLVSTL